MPVRKKERPYLELGRALEEWRLPKFPTAIALCRSAKFSFHYSVYADFERGATLPSIGALLEVSSFLGQDPARAVRLWAEVQMPSEELKKVFRGAPRPHEPEKPRVVEKRAAAAPNFENTWVFGADELRALKRYPRLWELCLALSVAHPEPLDMKQAEAITRIKHSDLPKHLTGWRKSGHVIIEGDAIRLRHPHVHLPKTAEWNEIRQDNLKRAVEGTLQQITSYKLDAGECHRGLIHRALTPKQAQEWASKLKILESQLKSEPYLDHDESGVAETHTLIQVVGPRKFTDSRD